MAHLPTTILHTKRRRPLTPWELPVLLTPLFTYKRPPKTPAKERTFLPAVLNFVYRNRFAVSSQVQRRFSQHLKSDRTTRRRLAELQALGLLGVAPTRSTSPLWPKVYFVTGRGLQKLRRALAAQGTSWTPVTVDRSSRHKLEGYSSDHVVHEVMTTELLLAVWQTITKRADLELLTTQRRALAKHPAFVLQVKGKETRLVPDALFLFRQKGGGMIVSLVEMDTGEMNMKQLTAKLTRYEAWTTSEAGQRYLVSLYQEHGAKNPQASFRVLFVCEDRAATGGLNRMTEVLRLSLFFPNALLDKLWFTTVADLRYHQHDVLPLGASIWRRGKDARPWRDDIRTELTKAKRKKEAEAGVIRAIVQERISTLPLHPLFPHPMALAGP